MKEHADSIKSERVYLPIYWMNNYHRQAATGIQSGFWGVDAVQKFLDGKLDSNTQYVSVVQNADGPYERLPSNLTLLGAGGTGDVPLPLVCHPHPRHECFRGITASFVGTVTCGGPLYHDRKPIRSSNNPKGIGTRIRQKMMQVFPQWDPAFWLEERVGWGYADIRIFRDAMYHSRYALAPRGYGKTSFRLYEAMQLGCVPVYIYDDPWLPYADKLDWNTFAVLCHFSELDSLRDRLTQIDEAWRAYAVRLLIKLVPEFFSLGGITKQLPGIIEGLDK
jgi:hypothetical protein